MTLDIMQSIEPGLLSLIPVLYLVGYAIKKTGAVKANYIPLILGGVGIGVSTLWLIGAGDGGNIATLVFSAIIQGILCAGASVYANQIWKQIGGGAGT